MRQCICLPVDTFVVYASPFNLQIEMRGVFRTSRRLRMWSPPQNLSHTDLSSSRLIKECVIVCTLAVNHLRWLSCVSVATDGYQPYLSLMKLIEEPLKTLSSEEILRSLTSLDHPTTQQPANSNLHSLDCCCKGNSFFFSNIKADWLHTVPISGKKEL